jgi:hypothetical protein
MNKKASRPIVLPSGESVPRAAWNVLVRLERRGYAFEAKGNELTVRPGVPPHSWDDHELRDHAGAIIALIGGMTGGAH